jgi:antitoxin VapB
VGLPAHHDVEFPAICSAKSRIGVEMGGGCSVRALGFRDHGFAFCLSWHLESWMQSLSGRMVALMWYNSTMSINIKSEEAHRLAKQLSKLTGESMTVAVTEAMRERLERLRRARGPGMADRLLKIGKDCAPRLKEPFRSVDHAELLYDERGLPK